MMISDHTMKFDGMNFYGQHLSIDLQNLNSKLKREE